MAIKNKRLVTSIGNISVGQSYAGGEAAKQVGKAISGLGDVLDNTVTYANRKNTSGQSIEYINTLGAIQRQEITDVNVIKDNVSDPKELAKLTQAFLNQDYEADQRILTDSVATRIFVGPIREFMNKHFDTTQTGTITFGNNLDNFNSEEEFDKFIEIFKDGEFLSLSKENQETIRSKIVLQMSNKVSALQGNHNIIVRATAENKEWNEYQDSYNDLAEVAVYTDGLGGLIKFNKEFEDGAVQVAEKLRKTYLRGTITSRGLQIFTDTIINEAYKSDEKEEYIKSWIKVLNNKQESVGVTIDGKTEFITKDNLNDFGINPENQVEFERELTEHLNLSVSIQSGVQYLGAGGSNGIYTDLQTAEIEKVTISAIEELTTNQIDSSFANMPPEEKRKYLTSLAYTTASESNYVGNSLSGQIFNQLVTSNDIVEIMEIVSTFAKIESVNTGAIEYGDGESAKKLKDLINHYAVDPEFSLLSGNSISEKVQTYLQNNEPMINAELITVSMKTRGGNLKTSVKLDSLLGISNNVLSVNDQKSFTDLLSDGLDGLDSKSEKNQLQKDLGLDKTFMGTNKKDVAKFSQMLTSRNPIFADFIKNEILNSVSNQLNNTTEGNNEAIDYNTLKSYTVNAVIRFSKQFTYDPDSRNGFVKRNRVPVTAETLNFPRDQQVRIVDGSGDKIFNHIDNTDKGFYDKDDLQLEYAGEVSIPDAKGDFVARAFQVYILDNSGISVEAYRITEDGTRKNIIWYDTGDKPFTQEELKKKAEERLTTINNSQSRLEEILNPFGFSREVY